MANQTGSPPPETPQTPASHLVLLTPSVARQMEDPTTGQAFGAAGMRVGSALVGGLIGAVPSPITTPVAAVIGGGGELAAQAIEEGSLAPFWDALTGNTRRLGRASIEAGIAATPGAWIVRGGRAISSLLRSGALAGAGELGRQYTRGEAEPAWGRVFQSGLFGGAVGGALGKVLPAPAGAAAAATAASPTAKAASYVDLAATSGEDIPAFVAAATQRVQTGTVRNLDMLLKEAAAVETGGMPVHAQELRKIVLSAFPLEHKTIHETVLRLAAQPTNIDEAIKVAEAARDAGVIGPQTSLWLRRTYDQIQRASKEAAAAAAKKAAEAQKAAREAAALEQAQQIYNDVLAAGGGAGAVRATKTMTGVHPTTGERISIQVQPQAPVVTPTPTSRLQDLIEDVGTAPPPAAAVAQARPAAPRSAAPTGAAAPAPVAPTVPTTPAAVPAPAAPVVSAAPPAAAAAPTPPAVAPVAAAPPAAMPAPAAAVADAAPVVPVRAGTARAQPAASAGAPPPAPVPAAPAATAPAAGQPSTTRAARGALSRQDIQTLVPREEADAIAEDIIWRAFATSEHPEAPNLAARMVWAGKQYRQAAYSDAPARALGAALDDMDQAIIKSGALSRDAVKQIRKDIREAIQEIAVLRQQALEEVSSQEARQAAAVARDMATTGAIPAADVPKAAKALTEAADTLVPSEAPTAALERALAAINTPPELAKEVLAYKLAALEGRYDPATAKRIENELSIKLLRAVAPKKAGPTSGGQAGAGTGGTVLGVGLGSFQDLIDKHPETAVKLGLIAGGALVGAVVDPVGDPLIGAMLGAGAGWSGPRILSHLRHAGIRSEDLPQMAQALQGAKSRETVGATLYQLMPHIVRANFLYHHVGLPANAWAGPWGAGFFGTLTKALANDPRAVSAWKELASGSSWMRTYIDSIPEARELVRMASVGDPHFRFDPGSLDVLGRIAQAHPRGGEALRHYVHTPAVLMAAGDLATRKILMKHGFSLNEAREMTLTSEPVWPVLRALVHTKRAAARDPVAGPLWDTMLPFIRTPANVLEQGIQRLPGLGLLAQSRMAQSGHLPKPLREKLVEQALSTILGTSAWVIGLVTPPEQASSVRRVLSNISGQYGLVTALGFAAGQGSQRTNTGPIGGLKSAEMAKAIEYSFPVPAPATIRSLYELGTGMTNWLPRGVVPDAVWDLSRPQTKQFVLDRHLDTR